LLSLLPKHGSALRRYMGRSLVGAILKSSPSAMAGSEKDFVLITGVGDDATFNSLPAWMQTPDNQDHCYVGALPLLPPFGFHEASHVPAVVAARLSCVASSAARRTARAARRCALRQSAPVHLG
jgi:hypothetical protein